MKSWNISPITASEMVSYLVLLDEFRKEDGLPRSLMTLNDLQDKVITRRRAFAIHLARISGSSIGFVSFQAFYEPSANVFGMHLCDIYVKSVYRRQGIGLALFDSCKKVACRTNMKFIWWVTRLENFPMTGFAKDVGATYSAVNSVMVPV